MQQRSDCRVAYRRAGDIPEARCDVVLQPFVLHDVSCNDNELLVALWDFKNRTVVEQDGVFKNPFNRVILCRLSVTKCSK